MYIDKCMLINALLVNALFIKPSCIIMPRMKHDIKYLRKWDRFNNYVISWGSVINSLPCKGGCYVLLRKMLQVEYFIKNVYLIFYRNDFNSIQIILIPYKNKPLFEDCQGARSGSVTSRRMSICEPGNRKKNANNQI